MPFYSRNITPLFASWVFLIMVPHSEWLKPTHMHQCLHRKKRNGRRQAASSNRTALLPSAPLPSAVVRFFFSFSAESVYTARYIRTIAYFSGKGRKKWSRAQSAGDPPGGKGERVKRRESPTGHGAGLERLSSSWVAVHLFDMEIRFQSEAFCSLFSSR